MPQRNESRDSMDIFAGAPRVPAPTHQRRSHRKPSLLNRTFGVIGEILITFGVLILLFIVWQVWYTDIGANRLQAEEVSAFRNNIASSPDATPAVDDTAPVKIGEPQDGPPPGWDGEPPLGKALGVMHIPRFGYDFEYLIVNGTDMGSILNTGAFGRYDGTALPGEVGNFSTAAHRQTYGAPMRDVADLEIGDPIVVETENAYLVYKFIAEEIVSPTQISVIAPDPFSAEGETAESPRRLLTVTTCHPPFVSNSRWVIHAEFDHWVKRDDGLPLELVAPEDRPDEAEGTPKDEEK